jgi:hypothetical protein
VPDAGVESAAAEQSLGPHRRRADSGVGQCGADSAGFVGIRQRPISGDCRRRRQRHGEQWQ